MSGTLLLAWRYLAYHRVRTLLLVACLALSFLLPIAVQLLMSTFAADLGARAATTPLVAGAKGSRYDLVLNTLYFRGRVPAPLSMGAAREIGADGLATVVPVLHRRSAGGYPVVGTTPEYFEQRGLWAAAGNLPRVLGQAVLGARAARELGLAPGDTLLTDQGSLYDLSAGYPLRLRVVGALAKTGTADDQAVFVDVKTAWVLEGIGHGHGAADEEREDRILARDGDAVTLSAAVVEYTEITPDNLAGFHFHGSDDEHPLTGALVFPRDDKARTLLRGRYRVSSTTQLLVPAEVVDEVLGFVFRLKRFFDANALLVGAATLLFLTVVLLLTLRVRRRELLTFARLGVARGAVARLLATELCLVVAAGLGAAGLLAWGLASVLERTLLQG